MHDQENKLAKFKTAFEKIVEKAKEDGKVTSDEQDVLDEVQRRIDDYEIYLTKALEDEIIDQEEADKLHNLEEEILSGSYFTAMSDDKLTQDEILLLSTLIKSVYPTADIDWLKEDLENE